MGQRDSALEVGNEWTSSLPGQLPACVSSSARYQIAWTLSNQGDLLRLSDLD